MSGTPAFARLRDDVDDGAADMRRAGADDGDDDD
eukprot:CAMPEP_0203819136 /NCGR_PEP_ID=MMETSP0115-20131106/34186_1 /ASSEMBLY_ACC=CAM_ASM_000227 /TAXON_ID=33651 /ORGANISM="Bicosoecid sp, Strain ms1" /LENGTH=33 /DNA_ID= /DNA_START= /DNA_END= /DNA_ORIENTATION=